MRKLHSTEREDYSPFPLQCNKGISLIKSRHKFSLTLLLKDTLAKQVKLKYYTQGPTYEVLEQEAEICLQLKPWQLNHVFFHVSKTHSIMVRTT